MDDARDLLPALDLIDGLEARLGRTCAVLLRLRADLKAVTDDRDRLLVENRALRAQRRVA